MTDPDDPGGSPRPAGQFPNMTNEDCDGIPVTLESAGLVDQVQVRLMLAHGVRCPLCRAWVRRWRIENGLLLHERHDPGE